MIPRLKQKKETCGLPSNLEVRGFRHGYAIVLNGLNRIHPKLGGAELESELRLKKMVPADSWPGFSSRFEDNPEIPQSGQVMLSGRKCSFRMS